MFNFAQQLWEISFIYILYYTQDYLGATFLAIIMKHCASVLRIFSWYLMFLCFCRMMYFYSHQMPCLTIQQTQSTSGRYFLYWFEVHVLFVIRLYNPSCQSLHAHELSGVLDHVCFLVALFFRIGVKHETLVCLFFNFVGYFCKKALFISYYFLVIIICLWASYTLLVKHNVFNWLLVQLTRGHWRAT